MRPHPWSTSLSAVALLVLSGSGCEPAPRGEARTAVVRDSAVSVVDYADRTVRLARPARRVVSLIPSATETLFALGAGDRVVGRTNFDTAPFAASLPSVGGGLDPSLETLIALKPDLVIGWEAEKNPTLRERLESLGIPVIALRTTDTTDVFRTIRTLGTLTGRDRSADSLAASIRSELAEVRASVAGRPTPTVFYIVSNDPPMTPGPNTFISQIIAIAGGRTVFPDVGSDWPTVSMEEIVRRQPEVVVVPVGEMGSTRKVDELRAASGWRELRAFPAGRVVAVPTDLMNRPGPNLGAAARRMRDALHPDMAPR